MASGLKTLVKHLPPDVKRFLRGAIDLARASRNVAIRPYLAMRRAQRHAKVRHAEIARRPIALFLSPDAGVRIYHGAHAIIARTIAGTDIEPLFLSCNGLLPTCTMKQVSSMGPTRPSEPNAACATCRHESLATGNSYGLGDIAIETLLTPDDIERISKIVAGEFDPLLHFVHDEIAFGTLVLGDTLRQRRLTDASEFGEADRRLFRALLHSALSVYSALNALARRFDIQRIVFFGDYAYWLPVQIFGLRRNIGLAGLDYGYNVDIDQRYIGIRPISANAQALEKVENWQRYQDRPLPPGLSMRIFEGGLQRLSAHGGKSNFSPNWTIQERPLQEQLGLSVSRKTIVAYPSSSDEFVALSRILAELGTPFAQQARPFADQASWLQALVEWVGGRDNLQLVIRWHPRMGISRHHAGRASEYAFFKERFAQHPANVAMIWPEDKTSSYNLGEICDVCAVSWSTIGLELARLGVPTVASFPDIGNYPVGSFIGFGATPGAYFKTLEAALTKPASLVHITEAFRWTHYLFWSPLVDVSDIIPAATFHGIPTWKQPANSETIRRVILNGENLSTINMDSLPDGSTAEASERAAVLAAMRRAVVFFLTGEDRASARLTDVRALGCGNLSALIDGRRITRYSPLAARLALMLETQAAAAHSAVLKRDLQT